MDKEYIAGAIIMALCCGLCAMTFLTIGLHAEKAKKPVGFWSGKKVEAEKIRDIPGYNQANAVMWKQYSLLYWAATVLGILGLRGEAYIAVSAVLLSIACVPGLFWLIWRYKAIERQYIKP